MILYFNINCIFEFKDYLLLCPVCMVLYQFYYKKRFNRRLAFPTTESGITTFLVSYRRTFRVEPLLINGQHDQSQKDAPIQLSNSSSFPLCLYKKIIFSILKFFIFRSIYALVEFTFSDERRSGHVLKSSQILDCVHSLRGMLEK